MKKIFIGLMAATIFLAPAQFSSAKEVVVPEEIYTWVHSSARGNYFFNHQQLNYAVRDDGTIDLNTIIAPTICTYDNIQIDDVLQKRRWRMQSTAGYEDLIGRADYLRFDLEAGTVQITERVDLDSTFSPLSSDKNGRPTPLSSLSEKDVTRRFYRAILLWARDHSELMVNRSRGRLSAADSKLKPDDYPIKKFTWITSGDRS